jgi:hypothetical protein
MTIQFVVVTDMAPRNKSVCSACSRTLERGYLRDLFTSKCYCGVECYPPVNSLVGSAVMPDPFALAIAWPRLTVDVASALFDSALGDQP